MTILFVQVSAVMDDVAIENSVRRGSTCVDNIPRHATIDWPIVKRVSLLDVLSTVPNAIVSLCATQKA